MLPLKALNSRRRFLKNSVFATVAITVLNPFKKLFAYFKNEDQVPSWVELIEYARWCPTVHNLQPHKIKIISRTEAELYYDPARLLPVGDPNAIFVTVAMGIFHENLSIAASKYMSVVEMYEITAPVKIGGTAPVLFSRLKIVPSNKKEKLSRELIFKRKTSRIHYNGTPLKKETLEKINNEAAKFDHEFFSSSEPELIDYIIELNKETLFEDISVKADREELDNLFRYSEKEAREHKDGLWSRCMGFPGILMKSVFEHPRKWDHGLKKQFLSKNYGATFKGTATICWFGGRFNNTNDWLYAGRMLARNWLLITEDNAYLQPFGSLVTNTKAYEKINQKFTRLKDDKKIWMIFRAGYSKEPVRSFRLSTEEIIIT